MIKGKKRSVRAAGQEIAFDYNEQPQEAIRHLDRAVTIEPKDTQAWVWLGQGQQNSGNRAKACESYKRALDLDPAQADALNGKKVLGC